jgi:hypothetical protein
LFNVVCTDCRGSSSPEAGRKGGAETHVIALPFMTASRAGRSDRPFLNSELLTFMPSLPAITIGPSHFDLSTHLSVSRTEKGECATIFRLVAGTIPNLWMAVPLEAYDWCRRRPSSSTTRDELDTTKDDHVQLSASFQPFTRPCEPEGPSVPPPFNYFAPTPNLKQRSTPVASNTSIVAVSRL